MVSAMIFLHNSEEFRRVFGVEPPLEYFQEAKIYVIDISAPLVDDIDREHYLDTQGGE